MSDDKRVKGFEGSFGFGPSDHPEVKPLAFRIMAVGNFCGANRSGARPATVIDAHDFDKVMANFWPRLVFEVENQLGSGKTLEIDFTPESIKDFEPGRVAARIPALAPVAEFIERAQGLNDGSVKPADFKRDLSAVQAVPALREALELALDSLGGGDAPTVSVDDILGATSEAKPKGSAIDSFAAGLGSKGKGIDVSAAIAKAKEVLRNQLSAVINSHEFESLERNWRGLHLLCKRGKGAQIEVFDGDFEAWQEGVFNAELAGTTESPLALVLLCEKLDGSAASMEALQAWGDAGGQIQCPVVYHADYSFFNDSFATVAGRDAPGTFFDQPQFDKWRSLREKDESRWLVAACNPWLVRPALTHKRHNAEGPVLWGSPVWLVGAAVAQSMQRTGWPASHTGAADGEVAQLFVYPHSDGAEYPLEAVVSDRALKDLSRAGFTPLLCQPNNDSAWVILAPTVHKPSRAEEDGKLGTLAYQLLAARMGEMILRAKSRLIVQGDAEASAQNIAKYVAGLIAETGPGAGINIEGGDGQLILSIQTGRELLGGVTLQLGVNL